MRQDWTGEFGEERASIDGRVAFASAFLVLGCALIIMLDRIGVPERLVAVLGPLVALVSLAVLGALLHSMRISRFYAAGRRVPAIYAGFAATTLIAAFAASCLTALPAGVSPARFRHRTGGGRGDRRLRRAAARAEERSLLDCRSYRRAVSRHDSPHCHRRSRRDPRLRSRACGG
jgi:hypothetical protein